ncbi:MAG: hypothetical protein MK089_11820 [Phycisphaerales bacterium]|nr:hypothetical protein [Phycisphaerales bacterium]
MKVNCILSGLVFLLVAQSGVRAETIIAMPVPPQAAASAVSATPVTGLFTQGIEALDRYAAKSGRPRHQYSTSMPAVRSSGRYRPRQFYSSYEGPAWGWGGWGWYGSPIFVNNYWCGQPMPGRGICNVGRFTGVAVGF